MSSGGSLRTGNVSKAAYSEPDASIDEIAVDRAEQPAASSGEKEASTADAAVAESKENITGGTPPKAVQSDPVVAAGEPQAKRAQLPTATPPAHHPRAVAPGEIAFPQIEEQELERVEPRAALSEIGPALPPKPKTPEGGAKLARPVATAAGTLEVSGYRITISGLKPISPEETCSFEGKDWPCGTRARAAFRAWLRGRTVSCDIPPEADKMITVGCRVGKQDVGTWLVGNGWARAVPDGTYAEFGAKASQEKKGVFGPPPAMDAPPVTAVSSELPAPSAESGVTTSILAPEPAIASENSDPLGPAIDVFPTPPVAPPEPLQ
jgi:endonuclease YncB( thermonuclease family)